jgi:hypothetical protein
MKYTLQDYNEKGQDARGNHKLYANFKEYENGTVSVYWAVKSLPRLGETFDGEITVGEYGPRFSRTFDQNQQSYQRTSANGAPAGRPTSRPDNSDGQRQGMAINNAAQYVKEWAIKEGKKLSPAEYAQAVKAYAVAIYTNSDLSSVKVEDPLTEQIGSDTFDKALSEELDKKVADIFGAN